MGDKSKIEWTEATWNPIAGCSLVSEGCRNCYAMRVAERMAGFGQEKYKGLTNRVNGHPVWTGEVRLDEKALALPLTWKKPRRIFVNSMSDLFHEKLTDDQINRVFKVMQTANWHVFQVLTKRPERMNVFLQKQVMVPWGGFNFGRDTGRNIWLGASVENQETADERIPHLLSTPAAVRWLSCEPLLGEIALSHFLKQPGGQDEFFDYGIDWMVVGGESGPSARPMNPDWARSLRDQCTSAGVPFFFKQWGAYEQGMKEWGNNKKRAGRLLDGREWNEYPSAMVTA